MSNREKNFISVVAYTHNCQDIVTIWLERTLGILEKYFDKYEIIFVNDCSSDRSVEIIRDFVKERKIDHIISIINMSYFHGLEASMNAGVDLSIGDFVFEFDDLYAGYNPELIWSIYERSLLGYDIVAAVPVVRTDLFSNIFYKLYNWSKRQEGRTYSLERESFRVLSRRAINRVKSMGNYIPYRKAMYISCGLPYDKIEYAMEKSRDRKYDAKQVKNRNELAVDSLILFTDVVTKVTLMLSCLFLAFAIFTGGYTVITYFGNQRPIEGWAPIMGFLSAAFGGVFIILTIVVKYLSLALNMLFKKQNYLIKSIEKLTD